MHGLRLRDNPNDTNCGKSYNNKQDAVCRCINFTFLTLSRTALAISVQNWRPFNSRVAFLVLPIVTPYNRRVAWVTKRLVQISLAASPDRLAQNSPGKSTTHSRRNFLPTTGALDPPAGTPLATTGPKKLPTAGDSV